jgi:large subunit ribosomal protein L10
LAISKRKKTELVAEYTEQLKRSQGVIFADYQGLSVGAMEGIRNDLRPIGAKFQVVKNRLLILALKEAGLSVPDEWLSSPTVISFCYEEVPSVAKVLVDAKKELDMLQIKGGVLGTKVIEAKQVEVIADLPPREVLLAQVLGTINAPATQMAGVVASGIRQVLNVLQAYVDKLEQLGAAAGGLGQAAEPA